jgi:hypothetical protein
MKRPPHLQVSLNCVFPRWSCYVTDGVGTAHGGFWKGFKTPAEMFAWLTGHGYARWDGPT